MSSIVINQSQFYKDLNVQRAIEDIESRYRYVDETEYFGNLVNFSTAKTEPYQRWVRYREGYSTSLVNELIQRSEIDADKNFIADPMVGSGSTIISAVKNGFDAFGVDVNPYCKLIADAKLQTPTDGDIEAIRLFIESLPRGYDISSTSLPPLSDYFPEENLSSLLGLKEDILQIPNETARQIALACWFFILEACSNRKKDGNGLATRPAPVNNAVPYYKSVVENVVQDYIKYPFGQKVSSEIFTGSACDFSKYSKQFEGATGKKLGAIIFSPPYANAFDYYESYKMELLFGQLYSMDDYQLHKKEQIRNYRISYGKELHCDYKIVELLCDAINLAIPQKEAATGKRDARTRLMPNMLRGYFTDMGKVLEELFVALEDGGKCYIVVDQSAYVGVIVPTDILLASIAEEKGFSIDEIIICRKASTSGQQRKAYPYLGNTLRESIVCLRK